MVRAGGGGAVVVELRDLDDADESVQAVLQLDVRRVVVGRGGVDVLLVEELRLQREVDGPGPRDESVGVRGLGRVHRRHHAAGGVVEAGDVRLRLGGHAVGGGAGEEGQEGLPLLALAGVALEVLGHPLARHGVLVQRAELVARAVGEAHGVKRAGLPGDFALMRGDGVDDVRVGGVDEREAAVRGVVVVEAAEGVAGPILEGGGRELRGVAGLHDADEPPEGVVLEAGGVAVEVREANHHARAPVVAGAGDEVRTAVAHADGLLLDVGVEDGVVGVFLLVTGSGGGVERVADEGEVAEGVVLGARGVDGVARGEARVADGFRDGGEGGRERRAVHELLAAVHQAARAHLSERQAGEGPTIVVASRLGDELAGLVRDALDGGQADKPGVEVEGVGRVGEPFVIVGGAGGVLAVVPVENRVPEEVHVVLGVDEFLGAHRDERVRARQRAVGLDDFLPVRHREREAHVATVGGRGVDGEARLRRAESVHVAEAVRRAVDGLDAPGVRLAGERDGVAGGQAVGLRGIGAAHVGGEERDLGPEHLALERLLLVAGAALQLVNLAVVVVVHAVGHAGVEAEARDGAGRVDGDGVGAGVAVIAALDLLGERKATKLLLPVVVKAVVVKQLGDVFVRAGFAIEVHAEALGDFADDLRRERQARVPRHAGGAVGEIVFGGGLVFDGGAQADAVVNRGEQVRLRGAEEVHVINVVVAGGGIEVLPEKVRGAVAVDVGLLEHGLAANVNGRVLAAEFGREGVVAAIDPEGDEVVADGHHIGEAVAVDVAELHVLQRDGAEVHVARHHHAASPSAAALVRPEGDFQQRAELADAHEVEQAVAIHVGELHLLVRHFRTATRRLAELDAVRRRDVAHLRLAEKEQAPHFPAVGAVQVILEAVRRRAHEINQLVVVEVQRAHGGVAEIERREWALVGSLAAPRGFRVVVAEGLGEVRVEDEAVIRAAELLDKVNAPVAVEVGELNRVPAEPDVCRKGDEVGAGSERAIAEVVIDRVLAVERVGVEEVGQAVAVDVGDGEAGVAQRIRRRVHEASARRERAVHARVAEAQRREVGGLANGAVVELRDLAEQREELADIAGGHGFNRVVRIRRVAQGVAADQVALRADGNLPAAARRANLEAAEEAAEGIGANLVVKVDRMVVRAKEAVANLRAVEFAGRIRKGRVEILHAVAVDIGDGLDEPLEALREAGAAGLAHPRRRVGAEAVALAGLVMDFPALAEPPDAHEVRLVLHAERAIRQRHEFLAHEGERVRAAVGRNALLDLPLDGHRRPAPREAECAVAGAGVVAQHDLGLEAVHAGRDGDLDRVGGRAGVELRLEGVAQPFNRAGAAGQRNLVQADALLHVGRAARDGRDQRGEHYGGESRH